MPGAMSFSSATSRPEAVAASSQTTSTSSEKFARSSVTLCVPWSIRVILSSWFMSADIFRDCRSTTSIDSS